MPISRTVNVSLEAGGQTLGGAVTLTASGNTSISESCAASNTTEIVCTIDVSALKMIFMVADNDCDVEFNGPNIEVQLQAGRPFVWFATGDLANPFGSTDVTSLSVTNGPGSAANLWIEILADATP